MIVGTGEWHSDVHDLLGELQWSDLGSFHDVLELLRELR